jgi:hypothetical protein
MAYIPKHPKWWLATVVEEIRVEGAKRNIIHLNYVLVRADSAENAYSKAMKMGKQASSDYRNPAGKKVRIRFRGLRNLDVIHDDLEDGSELMFQERLGLSEPAIRKLVRPKRQLEAFLPVRRRPGRPDYMSKEIMDKLRQTLSRDA